MSQHLIIAPVLIPFLAGALMLLYDDRERAAKFWISLLACMLQLVVAFQLAVRAQSGDMFGFEGMTFYLLGDWPAPMGIVLVLDRLAAMMLVLTAILALPTLLYARAGWHRQGQHFYSLLQFLLMGLNGAFLTGDLFNLFVFFEVLLAASYGLLLHGSGQLRVRAGMHYIAINLAGSLLFLLGVALIYGTTGTLNMAHLASIVAQITPEDRPILHAGFALLGIAFLIKSGIWPLSFWLPTAYMAAAAPVGAIFAVMTKVGLYSILRLGSLVLGESSGASAGFGAPVLTMLGLATMLFGTLGLLASQGLGRMAAHSVLISSGTLLVVIGFALGGGGSEMLGGALYYMFGSTLASGILFLLVEPMNREDGGIAALLALTADAYGIDEPEAMDDAPSAGITIPAGTTTLGVCFALVLLALSGMPPFPGFIGKIAMIRGLVEGSAAFGGLGWVFIALVLFSGLATLIGMARIGIQTFWANEDRPPPVFALEIAPAIGLLLVLALLTFKAEVTLRYSIRTSAALHDASSYAYGVFTTPRAADKDGGDEE